MTPAEQAEYTARLEARAARQAAIDDARGFHANIGARAWSASSARRAAIKRTQIRRRRTPS